MRKYNPTRVASKDTAAPIEIDLVYNVRSCGTCSFFWPKDVNNQPYGPFPVFDFNSNFPKGNSPKKKEKDYEWLEATTREEAFPNGEVMDGCRKAPIMTIGINPNLTAFAPGLQGTSWAYPNFTSNDKTDAFAKYAYYYRYRSVFQEHLNIDVAKKYIISEGQIKAERKGKLVKAIRTSADPDYAIEVLYDGDNDTTVIQLKRELGTPRYVLLFDHYEPNNIFEAGQVIAARLNVPKNLPVDIYQGEIGYYEQFVPTLNYFQEFLQSKGCSDINLKIGEDVCQADMVACASPHWNEDYLGNQKDTIVHNCVSKNAWAVKQLVQTKPAVLFLVGEASYNMFHGAFASLFNRETPLSRYPEDGAFTLFKETIDSKKPTYLKFNTAIDGITYNLSTRIIVTPHFSYNTNYLPQFRMNQDDWKSFESNYPECYEFLTTDKRLHFVAAKKQGYFVAIEVIADLIKVLSELKTSYNEALTVLWNYYYNPHREMAKVLEDLYVKGELAYSNEKNGKPGYLTRTEGSCHFCVNDHWKFPLGCSYGKTKESQPPPGYLQQVASQMVIAGKPKEVVKV